MTEWIDVPVAEIAVGDWATVDGYGKREEFVYSFNAPSEKYPVLSIEGSDVVVDWRHGVPLAGGVTRHVHVRRSSIVAVRRRRPKPQPKPGDWRCVPDRDSVGMPLGKRQPCFLAVNGPACMRGYGHEVYRAGSGWSRDTRTGKPWVIQDGDPVEMMVKAEFGRLAETIKTGLVGWRIVGESWADYYKRIGLDIRPVERRKR